MSDYNINNMDFKQLRNEVQLLRDELAIMKRKYEDIIYNLDTDNFSQRIVKQGKDMYTKIEQTAEEINLQAEKIGENSKNIASLEITADEISSEVFYVDENGEKQSVITQTAEEIKSEVSDVTKDVSTLSSSITQTENNISLIVQGKYTKDILAKYLTGIEIKPEEIVIVIDRDEDYSTFNKDGLKFYKDGVLQGWAIEPSNNGGVLTHYFNGEQDVFFGHNISRSEFATGNDYTTTDIVLKEERGRFVVDVLDSNNPEIKFLCSNNSYNGSPRIFVNEQLLATQDWVLENAPVAVFG